MAVGRVGLGDHQDPARALVEAIDESGPGAPPTARAPGPAAFAVTDVVHQRVEQGARPMAGARVHHEARRLVHHQKLRVLVEHVQREGFGIDRRRLTNRHVTGDHVAGTDPPGGLGPPAIDGDQPTVDAPLRARA